MSVTPTVTPGDRDTSEASQSIVRIEFPAWVNESPKLARHLATSDVIAKVKFVSLDSATREHANYGYVVELIYKFEVVQYLKGNGPDELVVRMNSGPKYIYFPDVLVKRTESEALELANLWLQRSKNIFNYRRNGVLLLGQANQVGEYYFKSTEPSQGYGGYPVVGETWLAEEPDSMYRFQPQGGDSVEVSHSGLDALIEEMETFLEDDYASCVIGALNQRSRVRDQFLGVYRELTLGGYREPEAFPRSGAEIDSERSAYATVFTFRRPPYQTPRFSDYWLDGIDKDRFAFDTRADSPFTYEGLHTVRALPQGEYSVLYNQYHRSLPCDKHYPFDEDAWRSTDTAEWVVKVASSRGAIHEAFFDPMALDLGAGTYAADGNLRPDFFKFDPTATATTATIKLLVWESGTVTLKMKFDAPAVPPGHQVEFIAQNGDDLLRLSLDDAAAGEEFGNKTFRWGVCDQPWSDGDKLMLRIVRGGPNASGVTNDTECLTLPDG